jgi:hypothetical protein
MRGACANGFRLEKLAMGPATPTTRPLTSRFFEPIFVALGGVKFEPLDRFEALKN